jgi:hypothetical protein
MKEHKADFTERQQRLFELLSWALLIAAVALGAYFFAQAAAIPFIPM